jgi:hypothetical protein
MQEIQRYGKVKRMLITFNPAEATENYPAMFPRMGISSFKFSHARLFRST